MTSQYTTRAEALANGSLWYFTGKPCKRGHVADRHAKSGSCNSCRADAAKVFKTARPNYMSNYQKQWRETNPHKYGEYYDQRHLTNGAAYLYQQVKARAKKLGREFDLTPSDIVIPDVCPVFGIPLYVSKGCKTDNSPSVDRVDNERGYTKENIQVISWKANRMKSDSSLTDLKILVAFLDTVTC